LYAVSLFNGTVYHITVGGVLPVGLKNFTATAIRNGSRLNWATSYEENLRQLEIEFSRDGSNFSLELL